MARNETKKTKTPGKNFLNRYFDSGELTSLFMIFAGALLLRIFYIVETEGAPFFQHLFSDSKIYHEWALQIAFGGRTSTEPFFMAPVYPYILAVIYKIFGETIYLVRIIQAFVSALNIFIIYLAGREFHSRTTGYIAAVITALYSLFIFYSGAILSETFQVFTISLLILAVIKLESGYDRKKWFITGLLLGLSALFRGNILLFLPVALVWLVYRGFKKKEGNKAYIAAGLFLIGTLLPILPVTARNLIVSGEFVLMTSNGGINFYLGNNEKTPGVFVSPDEFNIHEDMAGKKYAQQRTGQKLSASEASSYWYGEGLDYIFSNPLEAAGLYFKKIMFLFGEAENPQATVMNIDYFRENYSNLLKLPLFNYFFVSMFGIAGIIFALRRKKEQRLLYWLVFSYILGTILFFVNGRFRLALTPALIVFASYALYSSFVFIKEARLREFKTPAIVLSLFLIVYVFVINKPKFTEYEALLHLGEIEYEKGNFEKAVEYYNRSLFYRDYYMTYVNLGNALARNRDFRNAVSAYHKAIARDPDNKMAYFNLGFAYTQTSEFDKAVKSFEKAIQLDPYFADAYRNLGITFYVQGQYAEALPLFEKYLELSDDETVKENVRIDIKNIKTYLRDSTNQGNT